jgi:arginine/lysine/ornithine decarboxylase
LLEALADYHARDRYGFTPPGHRQGRGADPRTVAAIGRDAFRSDVLATAGLDDRTSSHGYLSHAEELMADAVGAEQAFFSTCGSSLSVKAAMLAVAGGSQPGQPPRSPQNLHHVSPPAPSANRHANTSGQSPGHPA